MTDLHQCPHCAYRAFRDAKALDDHMNRVHRRISREKAPQPKATFNIWDDPRADQILTEGWKRGDTTREIAAALTAAGLPATRNSVISRSNRFGKRLGLERRKEVPPKPAPRRPEVGVLFAETTSRMCMFIEQADVLVGPVVCCGKAVAALGEPWCQAHRERALTDKSEEKPTAKPQRQGTGLFGSAAA